MTRPLGFMDGKLAFSALDQIAEADLADKVTFHVMGEPLLHPQFFEIVDHAKEIGVKVGLTTNGALLTPKMIERLAARELHQIDISLQTPDAESFRATRGTNMDFEKYTRGVLDLLAACRQTENPPIFKIRVMTTAFAKGMRSQLGIPPFLASSRALRETIFEWTRMIYDRLSIPLDSPGILSKINKIKIYAWNVVELYPKIFIETYVLTDWGNAFSQEKIVEAERGYCFGMRDHFAVLYSGEVTLCCVDYDGRTVIGDLNKASLMDILGCPALKEIALGFQKGRLEHPHCRRCLGSRSKLSAKVKPYLSVLGLKVLKPFFYRQIRIYEDT